MFASCSSYTGIQSMLREQNSGLLTVGHHQFDFTVATSWLVLLRWAPQKDREQISLPSSHRSVSPIETLTKDHKTLLHKVFVHSHPWFYTCSGDNWLHGANVWTICGLALLTFSAPSQYSFTMLQPSWITVAHLWMHIFLHVSIFLHVLFTLPTIFL